MQGGNAGHLGNPLSRRCADVQAAVAGIRERGGDIVWVKDHGGGRVNAFIRDHEGNLIELMQRPRVADSQALLHDARAATPV